MPASGYYRYPTIFNDTIVFVSEDDLWTVSASGGVARRLTANLGTISHPFFSPDGSLLAFTGREEGHSEVYVMPAEGGPVKRITYLGVTSSVVGWVPDGSKILFASDYRQPFDRFVSVYAVSPEGGEPESYPVGHAVSIAIDAKGRTVIGRNNNDPARWKRYKGGTAGDIWIDTKGTGTFKRLLQLKGNVARPLWLGERVVFLSDFEGIGNLYSCDLNGGDIQKHTDQRDYFARFPSTDGKRIVYHAGGDLYIFDPAADTSHKVDVTYYSPLTYRQRKFVEASKYLESYALHPKGHSLAITARGKSFVFGNFEGAVTPQGGETAPLRYRLTTWLNDGLRVVTVMDRGGVESLEIHSAKGGAPLSSDTTSNDTLSGAALSLAGLDIGRPTGLRVSPTEDQVLLSNHRNELILVDLTAKTMQIIDRSPARHIQGMDWSPDGRWIAYGYCPTAYTTELRIWDRTTSETKTVTKPVLHDAEPSFDPDGKYLYFIGTRELNPVYDNLHFDLGFPKGMKPYLLTLRADLLSPFVLKPGQEEKEEKEEKEAAKKEEQTEATEQSQAEKQEQEGAGSAVVEENDKKTDKPPRPVLIDFDGIANRVLAFPVADGVYGQIAGIKGKALFTSFPVESALNLDTMGGEKPPKGVLESFTFRDLKHEPLVDGITDFEISLDGKTLCYRARRSLRILKAGEKPDEKAGKEPGRKSGIVSLHRIKVSVDPSTEWQQMAQEAWRLQREYFWTEDMSQIDWQKVWERYSPLIARIGTRGELSDLLWEMQGELGTSHAYEMGGDYRSEPSYPQGFLGADLTYDAASDAYNISHIVVGAPGEARGSSPLIAPGINIAEGDKLRAINGRKLSRSVPPGELLVHLADSEVTLVVESADGKTREVTVKTLRSEFRSRYREWVDANRERVHRESNGRIGYVHIPDMGAHGYAEFHRTYLAEVAYDGLIVDVRYNRGGHVSPLLIEKLARKRVGYDISRWGQPEPYPSYSPGGPMVAITNQWAGSDGDIFSHVWKLMKLGPLVGKRTWGGVIGIWPRNPLADGAMTTQPEFSFWFQDVGWGVENYGTDPDIDIDVAPQDYVSGYDPQMEKALALINEAIETNPPVKPTFADRPNLALPPH